MKAIRIDRRTFLAGSAGTCAVLAGGLCGCSEEDAEYEDHGRSLPALAFCRGHVAYDTLIPSAGCRLAASE